MDPFPKLEGLMGIKRNRTRQTPEQIEAICRAWAKG
jgi:hypothetical protein